VMCLRLDDVSYGRCRVTVRKRDDHPLPQPAEPSGVSWPPRSPVPYSYSNKRSMTRGAR
jgi:hypothetical protein